MDPVANPYSPGAGLRPRELAGRAREIAEFDVVRQRAARGLASRSMMFFGLRGVGKTVLLSELADRSRADGWVVGRVEATTDSAHPFRAQVAQTLNRALRDVTGSWDVKGRVRRAFSIFKSFSLKTDPSGGYAIGIEVDPEAGRADTGALDVDLTDLAVGLAEAATDFGVGVALFVDEMQDLTAPELAAVCQACHEAGQRDAPFYVVGAGLPSLPRALAEARSYAERLFDYRSIDALDASDAEAALVRPARDVGIEYEDGAADMIVATSAGYPYFLQEFGKAAWDYAPGPGSITHEDARVAIEVGTRNLDNGFFRSRWDRATPAERDYMRGMAEDGNGPSSSGEVARRLGKTNPGIGPTRAGLIHKGLIYAPEHGLVAFTVPGMADFIGRQPEE